jgi:hypothetical protein
MDHSDSADGRSARQHADVAGDRSRRRCLQRHLRDGVRTVRLRRNVNNIIGQTIVVAPNSGTDVSDRYFYTVGGGRVGSQFPNESIELYISSGARFQERPIQRLVFSAGLHDEGSWRLEYTSTTSATTYPLHLYQGEEEATQILEHTGQMPVELWLLTP